MDKKIGVIGTGVWGTALSLTAAEAGNQVLCWAREKEVVDSINHFHVNTPYLPDLPLPDAIRATTDIAEVLSFADVILMTVSAQYSRSVFETMKPFIKETTTLVLCAKGIEVATGNLLSETAKEVFGPMVNLAILSGPGFAIEVAAKKPTSTTIACAQEGKSAQLAEMLGTPYFRPYLTTDMISPQIGGSVKNVLAIASGIVEGARLGEGARAALITRGLNEMIRLSKALGGHARTMMGMCGLGDLVLTASCCQSRNFSFGFEVGRAGHAKAALDGNTRTVEGIATTKAVLKRAMELGIEMPICSMVYKVLFEDYAIDSALKEFFARPYTEEGF